MFVSLMNQKLVDWKNNQIGKSVQWCKETEKRGRKWRDSFRLEL